MEELGASDAAPDAFIDPITQEVMRDPVTTVDGQTYERAAIEMWLQTHDTSPISNVRLETKTLTPNIALRKAIEDWYTKHFRTIPRSQLTIGKQLAVSSFKTVYAGKLHVHGAPNPTAVAVLEVRSGDVAAEVKTLVRLGRHPQLVRYIGVCQDQAESKTYILVEYAPLGSLAAAMEDIEDDITPAQQRELRDRVQCFCSGPPSVYACVSFVDPAVRRTPCPMQRSDDTAADLQRHGSSCSGRHCPP